MAAILKFVIFFPFEFQYSYKIQDLPPTPTPSNTHLQWHILCVLANIVHMYKQTAC